jgi:aspartokinase-like uncharacterized kinase
MMGVSLRAYARIRGCTEGAVRKAIAAKRITPNTDGTIDPERANQEWERNTFAGKTLHTPPRPTMVYQAAIPQSAEVTSDPIAAYLRARAVNETFKAKVAQLEYEERAGKLIQATKAGEYAAEFSAIVGDALSAWPDRLTPLVAASMEESVVHKILGNEVAALRRKIAKAIADAGL